MTATLIDACAYAGTGNVQKIGEMLKLCSVQYDDPNAAAVPKPAEAQAPTGANEPEPIAVEEQAAEPIEEDEVQPPPTDAQAEQKADQELEQKPKQETPTEKNPNDKADDTEDATTKPINLSTAQAVAVLGIGLIAMGEDIGSQMSQRTFGHLVSSPLPCR